MAADGSTDDTDSGNGPFSAAIDVAPAINPKASTIAVSRADGVTRAVVAPVAGKNIFAGQGAVIDTGADMDPITARAPFQFVELGEARRRRRRRLARLGPCACSAMRCAKPRAARYAVPIASGRGRAPKPVVRNPNESRLYGPTRAQRGCAADPVRRRGAGAGAAGPAICCWSMSSGPATSCRCWRSSASFPALKMVLVGATEGWTVADRIAARRRSGDRLGGQRSAGQLRACWPRPSPTSAGCAPPASRSSIGMIDDNDTRYLFNERQYAGNLVALAQRARARPASAGARRWR